MTRDHFNTLSFLIVLFILNLSLFIVWANVQKGDVKVKEFLLLLSQCTEAEQESSSVGARLSSCTDGVMKEMSGVAEEGRMTLEEGAGYCSLLQSSLESLAESSLQWCHAARDLTERRAKEQLTLAEENKATVHKLLKVRQLSNG